MAERRRPTGPFTGRRHYKQRWDPTAAFVYRRRLRLIVDGRVTYVGAGDDVDKDLWGRARLRRLWESQAIELKDWPAPRVGASVPVAEPEVPVAEPEVPVAEPEVPVAEPEGEEIGGDVGGE